MTKPRAVRGLPRKIDGLDLADSRNIVALDARLVTSMLSERCAIVCRIRPRTLRIRHYRYEPLRIAALATIRRIVGPRSSPRRRPKSDARLTPSRR